MNKYVCSSFFQASIEAKQIQNRYSVSPYVTIEYIFAYLTWTNRLRDRPVCETGDATWKLEQVGMQASLRT
jgi:hypothetical protein